MSGDYFIGEDRFRVHLPDLLLSESKNDAYNSWQMAGVMSTQCTDRQGETVLAKGLDFEDFINNGHFNDNHSQSTAAIVGYPESATYHKDLSEVNDSLEGREGWTCKGYVIKGTKRAKEIWELAKALQEGPRRLGFSIEGRIIRRSDKTIEKARIRNVAITNCPVNTDCTWDVMSKGFTNSDMAIKSMAAGYGVSPATQTGGGALRTESLDSKIKKNKKDALKRALEFDDMVKAMEVVMDSRPDWDVDAAAVFVQHLFNNGGKL